MKKGQIEKLRKEMVYLEDIKEVKSSSAPAAIGPYSQGILCGAFLFASGQLPINPINGQMAEGIKEQTHQSLENLRAIIEAAGGSMENAVKITVFLKDMNDFSAVNEVYGQHFKKHFPARSAIEVARLPKDARVEIEAIFYIG